MDSTLGVAPAVRRRGGRRLGARAGGAGAEPERRSSTGCAGSARSPATCTPSLASDAPIPSSRPRSRLRESLALLTATVDEEIEASSSTCPTTRGARADRGARRGGPRAAPLLSHAGSVGRVIRHHGDFHLGQVLWTRRGLDRPRLRGRAGAVAARAAPQALAAARRRGHAPFVRLRGLGGRDPARRRGAGGLGGAGARASSSTATCETIDPALRAARAPAIEKLLAVFELEKAVYELRYELNNRPDWVRIPVAGILRDCSDDRGDGGPVPLDATRRASPAAAFGELDRSGWRRAGPARGARTRSWAPTRPRPDRALRRLGARHARYVSVVGDFNDCGSRPPTSSGRVGGLTGIWEGRRLDLGALRPATATSTVRTRTGSALKADPVAFAAEVPPKTASVVFRSELRVARRRLDRGTARPVDARPADVGLRGARLLVAPRVSTGAPLADELAAYVRRSRLHPRRAAAGDAASLLRARGATR